MYYSDLRTAVTCHKALMYVLEKMGEMPTSYPMLNMAMTLACEGYVHNITVDCKDGNDGKCTVNTQPIGGLQGIIDQLESAIEWLTLEIHLEGVNSDEGEREGGTQPEDGDSRGEPEHLHPSEG